MANEKAPVVQDEEQEESTPLVDSVPAARIWATCDARRKRWRWLLLGEHHTPPVSALEPMEAPDDERVGICCSGGGIRSASFNLGALQALQADRRPNQGSRLQTAKYLAAVSGGSYIAAAFAMVAKTRDEGTNDPRGDDSDPDLVTQDAPPFHEGSPEEQYLRNRLSYMAPTGAAKALLVWRVLLGLCINLLLVGAVLTLVAAVLAAHYRATDPGLVGSGTHDVTPNAWISGSGLVLSAVAVVAGGFSLLLRPRSRPGLRRFLEVWSLPLFAAGLGVFVLEVVVPAIIAWLETEHGHAQAQTTGAVGAGASASIVAIVATILTQLRSEIADPARVIEDAEGKIAKLKPRARLALIYLATGLLGPLLMLLMLVVSTRVQVQTTDTALRIAAPAGALAVLVLFARFADINSWSLHPFYRRRLCTAFALRRTRGANDPPTGHAEQRREGELVPLSATTVEPKRPHYDSTEWPTLLVCASASISDPGASPPGRGVTSFTFSAQQLGGPLVGRVRTNVFESVVSPNRQRDFTLPAAVAMSGAAISPSMGKLTRPSLRFLMAMANLRLGVWVPNPRRLEAFVRIRRTLGRREAASGTRGRLKAWLRGSRAFAPDERVAALHEALEHGDAKQRLMPRPTPWYLLKELLGWTSINDKFLYVTDGGHYENLGLVELLRRGCCRIYCFDASNGEPLGALGDAIALARSELGVEITFPKRELDRLAEVGGYGRAACATGSIRYTRCRPEKTGTLVYAPTVMTRELPWDVQAFKRHDEHFPHHSTLDQLFTDQKFEAYRVLGGHAAKEAMRAMDAAVSAPAPASGEDAGERRPDRDGAAPRAVQVLSSLISAAVTARHTKR